MIGLPNIFPPPGLIGVPAAAGVEIVDCNVVVSTIVYTMSSTVVGQWRRPNVYIYWECEVPEWVGIGFLHSATFHSRFISGFAILRTLFPRDEDSIARAKATYSLTYTIGICRTRSSSFYGSELEFLGCVENPWNRSILVSTVGMSLTILWAMRATDFIPRLGSYPSIHGLVPIHLIW